MRRDKGASASAGRPDNGLAEDIHADLSSMAGRAQGGGDEGAGGEVGEEGPFEPGLLPDPISGDNPTMGAPVSLTDPEQELARRLEAALDFLWARIRSHANFTDPEFRKNFDEMAEAARGLHASLAGRGLEPKHHGYMLENRGVPPTDPEFYNHIHPADDLLKFIRDQDANNDPEDVTIGAEFEMPVFTRRWGHDDTYRIKRTETGWHIRSMEGGACDKEGAPWLFRLLRHDSVNYPKDLGGYMGYLWMMANEYGLTHEQVQEALKTLGGWISMLERGSPSGVWKGYK